MPATLGAVAVRVTRKSALAAPSGQRIHSMGNHPTTRVSSLWNALVLGSLS